MPSKNTRPALRFNEPLVTMVFPYRECPEILRDYNLYWNHMSAHAINNKHTLSS